MRGCSVSLITVLIHCVDQIPSPLSKRTYPFLDHFEQYRHVVSVLFLPLLRSCQQIVQMTQPKTFDSYPRSQGTPLRSAVYHALHKAILACSTNIVKYLLFFTRQASLWWVFWTWAWPEKQCYRPSPALKHSTFCWIISYRPFLESKSIPTLSLLSKIPLWSFLGTKMCAGYPNNLNTILVDFSPKLRLIRCQPIFWGQRANNEKILSVQDRCSPEGFIQVWFEEDWLKLVKNCNTMPLSQSIWLRCMSCRKSMLLSVFSSSLTHCNILKWLVGKQTLHSNRHCMFQPCIKLLKPFNNLRAAFGLGQFRKSSTFDN